ncbi:MAG TPA: hypothetical protein VF574_12235 [Allosphingosinicella sp.]|jgi:hypothetical protein
MARFEQMSDIDLRSLAAEVAEVLPRTYLGYSLGAANFDSVEISESVDVWLLSAEAVQTGSDLNSSIIPLNRWHHQLKVEGQALGYATSKSEDSESEPSRLTEISPDAQIADAFNRAVAVIDRQHPQDEVQVRLVVAPAYQTWFLYCRGAAIDEVYVLVTPLALLPDLGQPLQLARLRADSFISQLKEMPFEMGFSE